MIEIENALSNALYLRLKGFLYSDACPWYYDEYSAYDPSMLLDSQKDKNDFLFHNSFVYAPIINGKHNSSDSLLFEACALDALDKANQQVKQLFRVRVGLIMGSHNQVVHSPHVDFEYPHKTALLYMSTCDGDTIVYKEKFDFEKKQNMFQQLQSIGNNLTEDFRISCVENKISIFDGSFYHSSSSPTNASRRIVITINFE